MLVGWRKCILPCSHRAHVNYSYSLNFGDSNSKLKIKRCPCQIHRVMNLCRWAAVCNCWREAFGPLPVAITRPDAIMAWSPDRFATECPIPTGRGAADVIYMFSWLRALSGAALELLWLYIIHDDYVCILPTCGCLSENGPVHQTKRFYSSTTAQQHSVWPFFLPSFARLGSLGTTSTPTTADCALTWSDVRQISDALMCSFFLCWADDVWVVTEGGGRGGGVTRNQEPRTNLRGSLLAKSPVR